MIACPSCGAENRTDAKFCGDCGHRVRGPMHRVRHGERAFGKRFCDECGAALDGTSGGVAATPRREPPAAERRLVSVLFADLVGFTTAVGVARRGGRARAALALLRHLPPADRRLRRHGREVHRRRGDGRLGNADGDRGRRRASGACRARPRGGGVRARRRGGRRGAAGPRRRAHRRGGGDARRRRAGHGRRRSRQHGLARPVGRRAGHRVRRRVDATRDRAGDRLRGGRRVRAEGQGGLDAALARAAASSPGVRGALKSQRARGAVRRPRPRAAPDQGAVPRVRPRSARRTSSRSPGIAGIGKSRLGWEFYKYFDGIAETVYWHRGRCLAYGEGVTYWALADMVRMRCRIAEDEEPAVGAREAPRDARRAHPRRGGARASSSRGSHTCSASAEHETRERQDLFAAWRLFFERLADGVSDGARLRGHAVGGREPARLRRVPARLVAQLARSSSSPSPVPSCSSGGRPGAPGSAASPRSTSSRCPRRRWRSCWPASCPGLPTRCATRSSPAPRACRSTPSRPCACCSTAACSCRKAPSTG